MRQAGFFAALTAFAAAPAVAQSPAPPPGLYSNEEQVYFAGEAKETVPPRVNLIIVPTRPGIDTVPYTLSFVDAFGTPQFPPAPLAEIARQIGNGPFGDRISLTLNGHVLELRRARPVTCWVAIRKKQPKADGSDDWLFQRGVTLHDQGGRAMVGASDPAVDPVVIRLRNVTWAPGSTNHPVVTLYVHKPDQPVRAESYSWAAPDSSRIGINLRWMQAGCTIGDSSGSAVTAASFRG